MAKRNKVKRESVDNIRDEEILFRDVIPVKTSYSFDISDKFKNTAQRLAYSVYEQHDITFLLGPAGSGKSFLSCLFAVNDLIKENKDRIVLTRPVVEAGEHLGFLPGDFGEKIDPYMTPLYDCMHKIAGRNKSFAERIQKNTEVAPIAFLRGRTMDDSICILDEAQNCTWSQLLLYLTRLGENSKMIVTGDPHQSDIGKDSALMDVVLRLRGISGIGIVEFTEEHIVRHKLVSQIIQRLQRNS